MAAVSEPTNPYGHGAYGVYIVMKHGDTGREDILLREGTYVGFGSGMSNNVAEYKGLIAILEYLIKYGFNKQDISITIHGDSKLAVMQAMGLWKVKKGIYVPYAVKARQLAKQFNQKYLTIKWVPREQNEVCDRLSKDVLKKRDIVFKIQKED